MQPDANNTHDITRDNGHDRPTTSGDTSRPDVLTVAQVARLWGVSGRTVQRQCHAGKLRARRVESEFGEQWEIERAQVEQAATQRRQDPDKPATQATTMSRHVAPMSHPQPEAAPDFTARYIDRLESENDFLRRALEQRDRDAAELRAALREALKIAPRQLEQGTARNSQQDTQNAPMNTNIPTPSKAPESRGNGLEEEMSADELLALCRRISK